MPLPLAAALALALAPLALAPSAWAGAGCGLEGGLSARIADCEKPTKKGGGGAGAKRALIYMDQDKVNEPLYGIDQDVPSAVWRLVTKTKDYAQVWLHEGTGLLWSEAAEAPASGEPQDLCASEDLKGNIPKTFRLPTADEILEARNAGLSSVVERMEKKVFPLGDGASFFYDGSSHKVLDRKAARKTGFARAVICVAPSGAKPKTRRPAAR